MPGLAAINSRLLKYGLVISGGVLKKKGSPDGSISKAKISAVTRVATTYLSRMAYIGMLEKELASIQGLSKLSSPGAKTQAKSKAKGLLSTCGALGKTIESEFKSSQGTVIPPLKAAHDKVKQYKNQAATLIYQQGAVSTQACNAMSNMLKALREMQNTATQNML